MEKQAAGSHSFLHPIHPIHFPSLPLAKNKSVHPSLLISYESSKIHVVKKEKKRKKIHSSFILLPPFHVGKQLACKFHKLFIAVGSSEPSDSSQPPD